MIEFLHIADLRILVGQPIEIGQTPAGFRRLIPILGGEALGPALRGRIYPAGADFQVIRSDGVTELQARYALEMADGARIYIQNDGLRHGPAEAMERLRLGKPVDPALIYFRTVPRFETESEQYLWLTRHIFVGSGERHPDRVDLAVYQIS